MVGDGDQLPSLPVLPGCHEDMPHSAPGLSPALINDGYYLLPGESNSACSCVRCVGISFYIRFLQLGAQFWKETLTLRESFIPCPFWCSGQTLSCPSEPVGRLTPRVFNLCLCFFFVTKSPRLTSCLRLPWQRLAGVFCRLSLGQLAVTV